MHQNLTCVLRIYLGVSVVIRLVMFSLIRRGLDAFFDDKRITITVLVVWFIIVWVLFSWLGIFTTSYMQIGPNPQLTYMGMRLDTWSRYSVVLIFVIISTTINDIAGDAISPWMQNSIYDHKNRYIPYSKSTCLLISQLWAVYCAVMSIASIALVFSQFDLLAVRTFIDLVVNQYTTNRFLRNKVHSAERYNMWFEEMVDEADGENDIKPDSDELKVCESAESKPTKNKGKKNERVDAVRLSVSELEAHVEAQETVNEEKQVLLTSFEYVAKPAPLCPVAPPRQTTPLHQHSLQNISLDNV